MSQKFYSFNSNQPALATITRMTNGDVEAVLQTDRLIALPEEVFQDFIEQVTATCNAISDKPGSMISIY